METNRNIPNVSLFNVREVLRFQALSGFVDTPAAPSIWPCTPNVA